MKRFAMVVAAGVASAVLLGMRDAAALDESKTILGLLAMLPPYLVGVHEGRRA